ncbi:hypothetical protein SDC9_41244 [bioreactor metagenome]|uniref:Uncharacterized protein n=1 Tax=bioreactor metagenome TaxID=1076179 RepID=A0A644VUK7_9ZZZZ
MGKPISFANREVCDLTICDYKTQAPVHVLDYANVTTQEITGEEVFAYGGQGHPKKVTFYGEKGGTLACEVQILTAELFSIMTGAAIETTAKFIKRLELTASEGALTIPVGTTFAENTINVYAADDDCGTPLEVTVSGQTITLPESSTGDFIVYGIENITSGVKKMSIKSTTFPKAVTIYGETVMKGTDDALYPYKLIAYKATPQQNFSLGLSSSGDPTTLTITFDLLADGDNNLMDMILLEDE